MSTFNETEKAGLVPAVLTERFVMFGAGGVSVLAFGRNGEFHSAIALTPDNAVAMVGLVLSQVQLSPEARAQLQAMLAPPDAH